MRLTIFSTLSAVLLVSLAPCAHAGVVNGGGGKGLLCGSNLQVLDLYEAQLKGWPAPISSGEFDSDLKKYGVKALRQIAPDMSSSDLNDPSFPDRFLAEVKTGMLDKIIDIPSGQTLDFTDDATLPPLPTGCRFVQIAVNVVEFEGDKTEIKVYRDRSLWNQLSPVQQVALLIHEYIYWSARVVSQDLHRQINSDDTRLLIGKMFTGQETYEMFSPLWHKPKVLMCIFLAKIADGTYEAYQALAAAETEAGVEGTGVYFSILQNRALFTRTRAFLPHIRPEQLASGGTHEIVSSRIDNFLLDRHWNSILTIDDKYLKLNVTPINGAPLPEVEGGCGFMVPNQP